MIGMEYDKIIKYFKDNTALVSMNKIDEFFNRIPADDRMMVEKMETIMLFLISITNRL